MTAEAAGAVPDDLVTALILGVDPGRKGALALVDPDGIGATDSQMVAAAEDVVALVRGAER